MLTSGAIKVPVTTPNSKDDPADVKTEHITLPPSEMWAALDNRSAPMQPEPKPADAGPDKAQIIHAFINPSARSRTIPLVYPFTLNGEDVREVTVRRLTLGEVQDLLARTSGAALTAMDIYAEMTGLTAEILRGLDDEDGTAVTDAAYDFFPPRLRPDSASSEN
ncbi:Mu-like prophage FluMu protein [Rhizobium etli 8C-3]|uniref:Mu-like prophage FluMu protein n=1 Tax=Rhizobium etli 8C-3 TaxID=538025 RepID=A0A1L5P7E5_RHIET|nr:phage tail assembly protein [Rhizobium etli]APO76119.1 Mu-like prophage FluMu protein [Rhizobium etli 8C-3]